MQRKVFLQRNMPKGKHSFLKLFLWSAVALIVLVIITPLVTRHKGDKDASRKPIPEKSGMVVKEIPRSVIPVAQNNPAPPVEQKAGGSPNEPQSAPGPSAVPEAKAPSAAQDVESAAAPPIEKNIQVDVSPSKTQADLDAQEKERAAELAMARPTFGQQVFNDSPQAPAAKPSPVPPAAEKEKPAAPAGKNERHPLTGPGAKQQKMAAIQAAAQKATKPASGDGALFAQQASAAEKKANAKKAAEKKAAEKKAAEKKAEEKKLQKADAGKADSEKKVKSGGGSFAVQVGSFKEKQNAEEMQRSLEKKGYSVILKPVSNPKLGQLYVVQLQPVSDESKASTLMMQIRHEEKVKPVVIKLPGSGQ